MTETSRYFDFMAMNGCSAGEGYAPYFYGAFHPEAKNRTKGEEGIHYFSKVIDSLMLAQIFVFAK